MSKILLIGKTGQLGSALIQDGVRAGHEIVAPSKEELDILDSRAFHDILKEQKPEIVINTAAFNDLPLCEKEPGLTQAFRMNCTAVAKMAEISYKLNTWFVSFSTDYVFDGRKGIAYTEGDKPGPLQMYGLSKLAGEYGALSHDRSVIIRTCGLYGGTGSPQKGNFVLNRIEDSKKNDRIEVSNELTCSPTYAGDLSKSVLQLIDHGQTEKGLYHLVNEGQCTWYEFTKEIYNLLNIDTEVVPVDRHGRTGNMRKPPFTPLKNEKAKRLGIVLPHWKDALSRYLQERYEIVTKTPHQS